MARPSLYTPELVATIAERLSNGEPLAKICREEGMPHPSTVRDWMATHPDVSRAIARAREDGHDALAQEALEIADDGRRDYEVGEDGAKVVNHDHINRSKLRVHTRLQLLAKWDPRYADRQKIEHSGAISTSDPATVANQLVSMANQHPTLAPQIKAWAESLIARLPVATT